jgi:hypothetical protein
MDVDGDRVEVELNIYTRVQLGLLDTDPQADVARVPSLVPHGQAVHDCACHFCVS